MADTYRAVIPYESLDPLTIGASGDDDKVSRETLELEIPEANLLAAIYPDEPAPVAGRDRGGARRARVARRRAALLRAPGRQAPSVAIVIDNQFRPTPQSKLLPPVFDAVEAAGSTPVVCANGKVFPMSESDIEQKIGRAEPRAHGAPRDRVLPERAAQRRDVRRTSASRRAARPSGSTRRSRGAT